MATNNEITNLFKIKDLPIDKTAGTKLDCHEAYVGIHMQEQRFYEVHVEAFMGYGACGAGAFVYETPVRQIDTAEVLELARTYAPERYQEIEARVKSVERAYTVPHIASDTKENDSCVDCRGGKMTQDSSPASGNRLRKRNIAWIAGKVTDGTNVQNLCATYISRNHSIKYYVPTNANNKTQGIEPSFISLPDELETMAELIAYLKAYYPVLVPKHYQDDSTEAVRYYRPHSADMTIVSFNLFTGHYYFECTPEEISIFRNNQTHLHSVTLEKKVQITSLQWSVLTHILEEAGFMQWKSSDAAIKANRTIGGSVRGRFACRFNHATPDASKGFLFPKKDNVQDFSFVVAHGESFPDAYIALYETIWNMVKTWLNNADRADTEAPKVSLKQDTCVICGKTVSESAELCDNCLTKALEKLLSPAFIMGAMNPEDIINDLKTEMQNSCRFGVDTKVQPCIYCGANVPVPEKICQRCHMLVGKYMNDRVKKLNDNPTFEMLRKQIEFRHHAEPGRDLQTVFMGPEASGASYCIEWESEQDNEMVYYDAAGTPIKRNRSQSISDSLIKDLTFPTVVPVALTEEVNLRAVFQTDYSFDGHEIISIPSLKRQYIWMNPSEDMKKAKIYPLNIWQASSIQKGNHDILLRMMRDEAPAALTSQELAALARRLRAALMNSQIYPVKAQRSCLYKGRFTPCRRISLPQRSVPEITDVQAVYIFLRQRYGEQFVFFRRCGNLYRAFYCQTVEERGSIFNLYTPAECERYNLPKTEAVNEECVTDIMEGMCTVGPASCFDRVLSHEEAAYILRIIHGDRNAAPWQSLVGGDMLGGNIIYQDPSRNVTFSEPNQFIMELLDAIRSIAQKGSNLSLPDGYY